MLWETKHSTCFVAVVWNQTGGISEVCLWRAGEERDSPVHLRPFLHLPLHMRNQNGLTKVLAYFIGIWFNCYSFAASLLLWAPLLRGIQGRIHHEGGHHSEPWRPQISSSLLLDASIWYPSRSLRPTISRTELLVLPPDLLCSGLGGRSRHRRPSGGRQESSTSR